MVIIVIAIAVVLLVVVLGIAFLLVRNKGKTRSVIPHGSAQKKTNNAIPAHTAVNTTEKTMNTIIMDEEDLENTQKIAIDEPA